MGVYGCKLINALIPAREQFATFLVLSAYGLFVVYIDKDSIKTSIQRVCDPWPSGAPFVFFKMIG
jgi:hypothetical protein